MAKPHDNKGSERERRQERLAQQLRSNLAKRKAQNRGRNEVEEGGKVRPGGNTARDS
jgi:hypothetical protein